MNSLLKLKLRLSALVAIALLGVSCGDPLSNSLPLQNNDVPATWNYTVTFDSQGATVASNPTIKNVISPATTLVTLPVAPEKTGFIFAGWYTAAEGGGTEFLAGTAVSANVTVFAKWAVPDPVMVSLLAIPGVAVPATGAAPVTTPIDTPQYTGTISWSPTVSGTFEAITVYTADIVLAAKTGWTFTGVAANSLTVAGATVTHAINSGSLSAVFAATGVANYTSAKIGTLKLVPAGSFQRDGTGGNISIITAPYRMSQKEITRAQFLAIMGTDPSNSVYSSGMSDPVQMVNWYHAIAFCNKLSIAEGLSPVYAVTGINFATLTYASIPTTNNATWNAATATWANNGYRLPTAMEWMWAAMGATKDRSNGYLGTGTNTTGYAKGYAGSTEIAGAQVNIGNYAWFKTNSTKTYPAGGKTANELGLNDMTGNVWEWCWDWHGTYPTGTQTDYRGAASGQSRVERGGCYMTIVTYCTLAYRNYNVPNSQGDAFGFRVIRP